MPASWPSAVDRSFLPTAGWERLQQRAKLLRELRRFFEDAGYLEVETPILSADSVVDRHLDPFATVYAPDPRRPAAGQVLYLQTSPELGMKRLQAAGGQALYQVTRAFRNGEFGPRHNPEFTLVEWYRVGDTMRDQFTVLSALCERLLQRPKAEPLTYRAAFEQFVGLDPFRATVAELQATAKVRGLQTPGDPATLDRDGWLDLLLVECIEPQLGRGRPTILHDYPPSQAALAVIRPDDPPVAERFELYVDGVELANGYHELLDAAELHQRAQEQNRLRADDGKPTLPTESRLIEAMRAGIPPCAGVALGFDRLAMLAVGATSLAEVLAFPFDRA